MRCLVCLSFLIVSFNIANNKTVFAKEADLTLSQLSPRFNLRVLQKVCEHPKLKERLSSVADNISDLKNNLRLEMRAHMLERSLKLEQNMSYFYSNGFVSLASVPSRCSRVRPEDWSGVLERYKNLHDLRVHLNTTQHLRWENNIKVLLRAAYEAVFIKNVLLKSSFLNLKKFRLPVRRNWQLDPFWDVNNGTKVIKKVLSFPPIYPVDLDRQQFGYPQQRLQVLYKQFPILRWRDMSKTFGINGVMLDEKIFSVAFSSNKFNGVLLDRLKDDFRGKLPNLLELAKRHANDEVKSITIDTVSKGSIVLDEKQILNLRALQFYFINHLSDDSLKYVNSLSDDSLKAVSVIVDRYYADWLSYQNEVRVDACENEDFKIEEYRALLWSLLNSYSEEDGLDLLVAFCHHSWTRSNVKMLESGSQALYGAVFIAGILFSKIRPAARVIAPTAAALSFAMRLSKGLNTLRTERALLLLDKKEEDERIYNNGFNLIAIPSSVVGLHFGSKAIVNTGAWKFFIPFYGWKRAVSVHSSISFLFGRYADLKSHVDHKLNPLRTNNFWWNTWDDVLGLLITGHALGAAGKGGVATKMHATAIFAITYALFNVYVQNWSYLLNREDIVIANYKFNNLWGTLHSGTRNLIEWSLFWHAHKFISNTGLAYTFTTTYKLADLIQKKPHYSVSKLAYLEEDKNFFESFFTFPDYVKLFKGVKLDPNVFSSKEAPTLEEIKSLRVLMHAYSDNDSDRRQLVLYKN